MALPMIVALLGHRGAGKDAIAEVLCREAGYVNVKFARPLKDALVGIFGLANIDKQALAQSKGAAFEDLVQSEMRSLIKNTANMTRQTILIHKLQAELSALRGYAPKKKHKGDGLPPF